MTKQLINRKVKELFEYRHIPFLLELAGLERDKGFIKMLYDLQISIYYLDQVLESGWNVPKGTLADKWSGIFDILDQLGYHKESAKRLVRDIEIYQRHELNMRLDKWPTFYTFKYLYYYKSCDVKLIRKLIYQRVPTLGKNLPETYWRFFDLITEVNDDVEDVIEDLDTINGNRYLISILQNGMAQTNDEFQQFLNQIEENFIQFFRQAKKNTSVNSLTKWTKSELGNTRQLIDNHGVDLKEAFFEKALLAPHLYVEAV